MKKIIKISCIALIIVSSLFILTACTTNKKDKKTEEKQTKKQITLGKWSGNTYTNDYLKIKFEMPSNWQRYSDEEILEVMKIGLEYLDNDEKITEKLLELNNVSFLMASDPDTGSSVIMMSEKVALKNASIKFYTDVLKKQLGSVTAMNYELYDSKEEEIAGENYTAMTFKASSNGIDMMQKYYVRKIDDYFFSIILTSPDNEDFLNEMVNSISSY